MPLVTLFRDGELALVDTDTKATYETFIANGWAPESPAQTVETPPAEDPPPVKAEEPKIENASPRGRKAKQ
jgi:hypothetical protein